MRALRVPPHLGRAIIRGDKRTHRIPAGRSEVCAYEVNGPPRVVVDDDSGVHIGREPGLYHLEFEQPLTDAFGAVVRDPTTQKPRLTYATRTLIRVTGIARERLEDITDEAAALEGFDSFAAFLDYWNATHNPYAADTEPAARSYLSERRMRSFVWVIAFTAEQQDAIHLLPNLPGEPEAVDPAEVPNLKHSVEAAQRWVRDRADLEAKYAALSHGERLDMALERARTERNSEALRKLRLAERLLTESERTLDRAA
jgi:hypothetical protein